MKERIEAIAGSLEAQRREWRGYSSHRMARSVSQPPILLVNAGWVVLGATLALCGVGIYCIDLAGGLEGGVGLTGTAKRQGVFVLIGLVAAMVVALPHYRRYVHLAWPLAAVTIALLVFLLIPFVPESIVRPVKGGRRWINVGVTDFQPSEVAKVVFVLAEASYLRYRKNHRSVLGLVVPGLIAVVPMGLILVEPDLGTALLFMPALIAMLIAAGARLVHLFSAGAIGLTFAIVVVVASLGLARAERYPLLREHQVERIQAVVEQFRGDDRFVHERGFQGKQATTLVGAGRWTGTNPEKARALVYFSSLPERHNDMIFAVYTVRFGLLGAIGLLGLYGAWVGGALWVAASCKDPFGRLVCVGLGTLIATQMGINIGMTIGLLPITGMTLPFVSYGGSSLVMGFVMVGLVVNIAMRRPQYLWQRSFEFDDDEGV